MSTRLIARGVRDEVGDLQSRLLHGLRLEALEDRNGFSTVRPVGVDPEATEMFEDERTPALAVFEDKNHSRRYDSLHNLSDKHLQGAGCRVVVVVHAADLRRTFHDRSQPKISGAREER